MDDPIADFIQWYKGRPILAKSYITISFILAATLSFTSLSIYDIFYTYDIGLLNYELWRPFTSLFYLGGLQLGYFLAAYFSYIILFHAQKEGFGKQKLADYIMFLIFDFLLIALIATFYDLYFLSQGFIFAILYATSSLKPFLTFKLLFGIDLQGIYFAFVYAGFLIIVGQSFVAVLSGFLIGFFYFRIKTTIRNKIGFDLWPTPSILNKVVNLYISWSQPRNMEENQEGEQADQ